MRTFFFEGEAREALKFRSRIIVKRSEVSSTGRFFKWKFRLPVLRRAMSRTSSGVVRIVSECQRGGH